jgi:hypothetical protein
VPLILDTSTRLPARRAAISKTFCGRAAYVDEHLDAVTLHHNQSIRRPRRQDSPERSVGTRFAVNSLMTMSLRVVIPARRMDGPTNHISTANAS